ncbi:protein DJ-1 [Sphaeroforma arctica JP610]|uniref:Protein DJ-1 n=1 Tax=Sphaeroforma arctica JP610 TaxID=667725 RepID=A0A0L0G325_9EUKA|nr:protein DJ-1 [Sphaeroforma arctica JP610]KNC83532.1 protein DJ-1 [Sphaeroforma arctica JP610]|eukprot:XP_014157434.1 protein DJ-1 [Sphaeroforma arctica JP610]
MPTALVILAPGQEEIETTAAIDILRRGKVEVTVAGLEGTDAVVCSRNVSIVPDESLESAASKGPYDMIVLPGGMGGAKANAASSAVKSLLAEQEKADRYIALICAGPLSLISHGIGKGKKVTSHPCIKDDLIKAEYEYSEDRVVVDGKLITSRGPGSAIEWGLALVEQLVGKETADEVRAPLIML